VPIDVERVNILDYTHDPNVCKIVTPAFPAAMNDSKQLSKITGGSVYVSEDIRKALLGRINDYEARSEKMQSTLKKMFSTRSLDELKPHLPV